MVDCARALLCNLQGGHMSVDAVNKACEISENITPVEMLVLLNLVFNADDKNHHCILAIQEIARQCKISKYRVNKSIKGLQEKRLIKSISRFDSCGMKLSNCYCLLVIDSCREL